MYVCFVCRRIGIRAARRCFTRAAGGWCAARCRVRPLATRRATKPNCSSRTLRPVWSKTPERLRSFTILIANLLLRPNELHKWSNKRTILSSLRVKFYIFFCLRHIFFWCNVKVDIDNNFQFFVCLRKQQPLQQQQHQPHNYNHHLYLKTHLICSSIRILITFLAQKFYKIRRNKAKFDDLMMVLNR